MKEVQSFYTHLYSEDEIDKESVDEVLSHLTARLSGDNKDFCDQPLTKEELTSALKGLSRGKSPGNDGLSVEFYYHFWKELSGVFVDVCRGIFDAKSLTRSMRTGIISLIFERRGDREKLKNWRPITLLNVDYKILSRCMANRLKVVIESIISPFQSCCIPGRDIADTIASIRDVISYVQDDNLDLFILKLDQEKAFDRVSHPFLFEVLKHFGFGDNFITWIKAFYFYIRSAVKVNGFVTPFLKFLNLSDRGARFPPCCMF